jgi:hypothetical protein
MRRKLILIGLLLGVAVSAHADPINIASIPPRPEVLGALLIEVLVVVAFLWHFRLRLVRFVFSWLVVNLLSFYILLNGIIVGLDSLSPVHDYTILAECVVIAVEAALLLWVSRLAFLRSADSKPVTFWWAFGASLAGNLASIVSFIGIIALESAIQR